MIIITRNGQVDIEREEEEEGLDLEQHDIDEDNRQRYADLKGTL